jgi:hypothetical protein
MIRHLSRGRRAVVLGALALLLVPAAQAARHHEDSALPADCNRACLEGFLDRYMQALLARDPARLSWARVVRFSENNVSLRLGDGLWGTITAHDAAQDLRFVDVEKGQAGLFGVVEEHGVPGYFALRLKIVDRRIAEVETQVNRTPPPAPGAAPGPFYADPKAFRHFPQMSETLPPAERTPRNRLVDLANGYFSTLQLNDGQLLTVFADDCARRENGFQSAGEPGSSSPAIRMSCGEQFRLGSYRMDSAVRDRDYVVVDEERGLVLARAFIDHNGVLTDFKLADGTPAVSFAKYPSSLSMLELFRIRNGKIERIEVVHIGVPYAMPTAWPAGE